MNFITILVALSFISHGLFDQLTNNPTRTIAIMRIMSLYLRGNNISEMKWNWRSMIDVNPNVRFEIDNTIE